MKPRIRIGCQGWNYEDWVTKPGGETVFYPRGTRADEMLEIYSKIFETVEVDSTVYGVPPVSTFENWHKKTPANFTFSLKTPREITHEGALRANTFSIMDEFLERAVVLGEKLACVLIQLAPQFEASKENARNLREFLARLPREIRFAVELRDRRWFVDWTFEELAKNGMAFCLAENRWIQREIVFEAIEKLPADFAYIRFMGERDLDKFDKVQRHEDANLRVWKREIERIEKKEIYIYISKFYEGHSPASVNKLKELLGQKPFDASDLENQRSLF